MAFDPVTVRTKELGLLDVACSHTVTRQLQERGIGGGRWELQNYVESITGHLVYQLRGMFAAENLTVLNIKFPADWWEAFKERWAPSWFTSRYPVAYRTHHIDLKAVYPEFPLPAQLGRMIRIQTWKCNVTKEPFDA